MPYTAKLGEMSVRALNAKYSGGTAGQRYTRDVTYKDSGESFQAHVSISFSSYTDKQKLGFVKFTGLHVSFKNSNWDCKIWFKTSGGGSFTFDSASGRPTDAMKTKAIAMVKPVLSNIGCRYG